MWSLNTVKFSTEAIVLPNIMDAKVSELYRIDLLILAVYSLQDWVISCHFSFIEIIDVLSTPITLLVVSWSMQEGVVDRWLKKEGDKFVSGEVICEVSLEGLSIGVEIPEDGYIAQILVEEGKTIPAGTIIARYSDSLEDLNEYKDKKRKEEEKLNQTHTETISESVKKDTKDLLREIKHLIHSGQIEEGSGKLISIESLTVSITCLEWIEFAKKLQSLARKSDGELISLFEASYEGENFNAETFDIKFFLENSKELIEERIQKDKSS